VHGLHWCAGFTCARTKLQTPKCRKPAICATLSNEPSRRPARPARWMMGFIGASWNRGHSNLDSGNDSTEAELRRQQGRSTRVRSGPRGRHCPATHLAGDRCRRVSPPAPDRRDRRGALLVGVNERCRSEQRGILRSFGSLPRACTRVLRRGSAMSAGRGTPDDLACVGRCPQAPDAFVKGNWRGL
jgi:hypothetical protein